MKHLEFLLKNGRWTINGKTFVQCTTSEKRYFNQFFKIKRTNTLKI